MGRGRNEMVGEHGAMVERGRLEGWEDDSCGGVSEGGATVPREKYGRARVAGVALVVASVVLYAVAGALMFSPLSAGWKAGAVPVLVVLAEGAFWLAAFVLGRQVVRRYRRSLNPRNWFGGRAPTATVAESGARRTEEGCGDPNTAHAHTTHGSAATARGTVGHSRQRGEGPEEGMARGTRVQAARRLGWMVFGVLMAASVAGSAAVVPYAMGLLGQGEGPEISAWTLLIAQVVQGLLFTAVAAGLGLWLGPRVGLGAPELRAVVAGEDGAWRRVRAGLPLAVGLGVASAAGFVALSAASAPLMPESFVESMSGVVMPSAWQGLLASFGAGINEEIWLRLGLMTLLVFVGAKLLGQGERPGAGVVWAAILLATLAFGAMHLPQMALLGGLTAFSVAFVLLGNGFIGAVFGWLYWRRGLLAAMVAHVAFDVVTKAIPPLFG